MAPRTSNGHSMELAKMIQDMNTDISSKLLAHQQTVSNAFTENTRVTAAIQRDLAGYQADIKVRVESLEDKAKTAEKRQWAHSMVVFAAATIHHSLSSILGWKF